MRANHHENEGPSMLRTRLVLLVTAVVAALFLTGAVQSSARAGTTSTSGETQTVRTTIDVAALVLENLCNKDTVNLHGRETITVSTTPTSNGGFRVVSSMRANNLTGERIAPLPAYGYVGSDDQDTNSYIAAPPNPSTYSELHWTKLVPQKANEPAMWLVVVTREVITADGTAIPTVERAYLSCSQPSSHDCHRES
jgi:hypothetical protein